MSNHYILTAFSKDRPGIVADITRIIYENNCNLEESAMANLAGEFALIFLFSPLSSSNGDDLEDLLAKECRRLEREQGISAFVKAVGPAQPATGQEETEPATILVEGLDQAGIVYKISNYLAENQINITSLTSAVKPSPESGATFYSMRIEVQIPKQAGRSDIERGLRRVGDELHVDVILN